MEDKLLGYIFQQVVGKTTRQMKEAMMTQRLSKEALRGIPRVAHEIHGLDDEADSEGDADGTEGKLYLFPHPDAAQHHEVISCT